MINRVTPIRLRGHPDRVDHGHHPDRDRVDRGGDGQQDQAEHDGVGGPGDRADRGIAADDLKAAPDRRPHCLHGDRRRGHRDHLSDDHGPAGEPADHVTGQPARPLIDRTGDRIATRQFGEAQGDQKLPGEDRRPGPEEHRAGKREPETEQLVDEADGGRGGGHHALLGIVPRARVTSSGP
jgi:hypothetical protein